MEYIDIVDENNNLTGKAFPKNIVHEKGYIYREVIGIIVNEKKEMLIQKRAQNKKDKAGLWELCCGHVSANEVPEKSMVRELEEEIGLKVEELKFLRIERLNEHNEDRTRFHNVFSYIYLIRTNKKENEFVLQKDEVSNVKYILIDDLKKEFIKNKEKFAFCNHKYIIDLLNEIKKIVEK